MILILSVVFPESVIILAFSFGIPNFFGKSKFCFEFFSSTSQPKDVWVFLLLFFFLNKSIKQCFKKPRWLFRRNWKTNDTFVTVWCEAWLWYKTYSTVLFSLMNSEFRAKLFKSQKCIYICIKNDCKDSEIRMTSSYTDVSDWSFMTNLWLLGSMNSSAKWRKGRDITVTMREKSVRRNEKTWPWCRAAVTGSSLTSVQWRPLLGSRYWMVGPWMR